MLNTERAQVKNLGILAMYTTYLLIKYFCIISMHNYKNWFLPKHGPENGEKEYSTVCQFYFIWVVFRLMYSKKSLPDTHHQTQDKFVGKISTDPNQYMLVNPDPFRLTDTVYFLWLRCSGNRIYHWCEIKFRNNDDFGVVAEHSALIVLGGI